MVMVFLVSVNGETKMKIKRFFVRIFNNESLILVHSNIFRIQFIQSPSIIVKHGM